MIDGDTIIKINGKPTKISDFFWNLKENINVYRKNNYIIKEILKRDYKIETLNGFDFVKYVYCNIKYRGKIYTIDSISLTENILIYYDNKFIPIKEYPNKLISYDYRGIYYCIETFNKQPIKIKNLILQCPPSSLIQ